MSTNTSPKHTTATDGKEYYDSIKFGPEFIETRIALSENVHQVAGLICLIEYDLEWDAYVSALVKEDAFSIRNGDRQIFRDYVVRMLEGEER